jgi:DNA-binding transcriptional MocR family regulator
LRFEGEHLPGLAERAPVERVMFTSSFSKTVAPGLRVGYVIMSPQMAASFATKANQTYISPAFLAQGALHQLIIGGHLEGNIAKVTDLMRKRRDAMVAGLSEMPDGTACTPPQGGFFLWMELPEGLSADQLFVPARDAGVVYVKGSDCFVEGGERTLRLAFSGVGPDEITEGMTRLGAVFRAAT